MRCYEQIRVNLALLSEVRPMNVNLIGVGAGYSYLMSGPTHQCYEDLTLMRALANMNVLSPADHVTAAALFDQCVAKPGLKYLRLDAQVLPVLYETAVPDVARGFNIHRRGADVCLVATGFMVHSALQVAARLADVGIDVGVIDLFNISGFDAEQFSAVLQSYAGVVTMEEGFRGRGGVDAMMFDFVVQRDLPVKVLNLGVAPGYRFELGSRAELHEQVGIGVNVAERSVAAFAQKLAPRAASRLAK
jgi:transketolase